MNHQAEFVLVHFLVPSADGTRFRTADWPLHLTLVPPFKTDASAAKVEETVTPLAPQTTPIPVPVGEPGQIGRAHDIPVMRIVANEALAELHRTLLEALTPLRPHFRNKEYVGGGYNPHVTDQRAGRVETGHTFTVDSVSLVDMSTPGQRDVLRTVRFASTPS